VVTACKALNECAFADMNGPISNWLAVTSHCNLMGDKIPPAMMSLVEFCGETLPYFMTLNASRLDYADRFNDRFGEPECRGNVLPRVFDSDTKESEKIWKISFIFPRLFSILIIL
jgi:hypothetical protein